MRIGLDLMMIAPRVTNPEMKNALDPMMIALDPMIIAMDTTIRAQGGIPPLDMTIKEDPTMLMIEALVIDPHEIM